MLSASFIDSLSGDGLLAFEQICREFEEFDAAHKEDPPASRHNDYLMFLSGLMALSLKHPNIAQSMPGVAANPVSDIANVRTSFANTSKHVTNSLRQRSANDFVNSNRDRFEAMMAGVGLYVFPDDDFGRVQKLISELREIISKSTEIAEGHKFRLLKRLEKLQVELHKEMTDLDRFVVFFFDIGPKLGQFGKDTEPLTKPLIELAKIIAGVMSITDKLSAPKLDKLLGLKPPSDDPPTAANS